MDKKRLSKILSKADPAVISELADTIRKTYEIVVIKPPNKTLTMIKMREPVKSTLFYIGEVIVTEAVVALEGVRGIAVTMGDDFEKALDMAVIDAACNKGVFTDTAVLLDLEKAQLEMDGKENAMHLHTMVNFNSMDMTAAASPSADKESTT